VWWFIARLASRSVADDLTQETYLRALRTLPRFAGRSSARTWLLSIARRVVIDHIRAATARPRTAAIDDWQDAADRQQPTGLPGIDDRVALDDLVAGLSGERREAFVLTQVLGLSYAEAADVCHCPVGTIRSRVARAREELVALLNGAERFDGDAHTG
jgi:RNA polymerase sigma-70 factor (ECF subfamily)